MFGINYKINTVTTIYIGIDSSLELIAIACTANCDRQCPSLWWDQISFTIKKWILYFFYCGYSVLAISLMDLLMKKKMRFSSRGNKSSSLNPGKLFWIKTWPWRRPERRPWLARDIMKWFLILWVILDYWSLFISVGPFFGLTMSWMGGVLFFFFQVGSTNFHKILTFNITV